MEDIISLIKDKEELKGVDKKFVKKILAEYIQENPEFMEKVDSSKSLEEFQRSQEYDDMLKEVRARLREVYGAFMLSKYEEIEEGLEGLRENQSVANHCKILSMHRSSKERLPFYERIYEKIFDMTGYPDVILDIACGLNPFSYPFLGCEPDYFACDISPKLAEYINEYFEMRQIKGEAFVQDMTKIDETNLPEADVSFLFKTLDSLESLEWDVSKRVLENIPVDYLAISFARQSLGGGQTIHGQRDWVEEIFLENNWDFDFFQFQNESFYVVDKRG